MENLKKIIKAKSEETNDIKEIAGSVYMMALRSAGLLDDEEKALLSKLGISEKDFFLEVTGAVTNNTIVAKIDQCMKELGIIQEVAEPEVETPDGPKATNKAQKLENRINNLIEKFEKETNPIWRQIYTARIAWLNEKFANALKIQQIKEEFAQRRTVKRAENLGKQTTQKIDKTALEVQIAGLKEQINDENKKLQPRFDPESPRFIFKSELARHDNNIESLLAEIESTESGAIIAQKIRDTVAAKKEAGVPDLKNRLGELEKKLAEEKGATIGRKVEEISGMGKLVQEELSLVSTEKKGILTRIADWGKALKSKWDERKKVKDAISAIREDSKEIIENYQEDVDTSVSNKKAQIAELKRQIAELEKGIEADKASVETFRTRVREGAKGDKTVIQQEKAKNQAARASEFRAGLTDIRDTTKVDFTPKAGATPETPSVDENEQEDEEQVL